MKNMKSWMLGAAVAAGAMGVGATTAQAAEFGIYARGPVAERPAPPWTGICLGGRLSGEWLLDSRTVELCGRA